MTVLFDLDGTLLDTATDFLHAVNQLLNTQGKKSLSLEELKPAVSHGLVEIMQACFNLSPDHPEYLSTTKNVIALYEKNISVYTKPFPGILKLLESLEKEKIRWGVVTNRPSRYTLTLLENSGLKDRACCIVSGDTTANPKPHPDPLFYACKEINVQPQNCIYIGDAERDIQAGKAAGMATIGVLFGYIPDIPTALAWGADYYVHHADEILPKILSWRSI